MISSLTPLRNTALSVVLSFGATAPATAAVVYVKPDIVIPVTFGGVYLDIVTSATSGSSGSGAPDGGGDSYTVSYSEPASWDVNFFFGGAGIAHSPTFQPYRSDSADNLSAIHNQQAGAVIDGAAVSPEPPTGPTIPLATPDFGGSGSGIDGGSGVADSGNHMGAAGNQFFAGSQGYIAFVLDPGTVSEHYGWIRVTLNDDGTEGTIHDWAYSPDPLAVGAIPEPGVGVLLLMAGMIGLRRRRP